MMEAEDKLKVLITLSPETRQDSGKVEALIGKVTETVEPDEVDQRRLHRYGIISSVADTDTVKTLKSFDGIADVEVVGEKQPYP